MIKLFKAFRLLCKITELYNAINNKNLDIKFWHASENKILYIFKF